MLTPAGFWTLCSRRMTLEESRQYQQQLQDAMFGEECQSEAVMDETCKLYSELISSYQSARHCSVSKLPVTSFSQLVSV